MKIGDDVFVDSRAFMDLTEFFYHGMDREIEEPLQNNRGKSINLGGSQKPLPGGPTNLELPEWNGDYDRIPYKDGTVGTIWALHFLEHITNVLHLLRECERVLMVGGVMNVVVPYGTGHMAVQDMTHVRFFNEDSWKELWSNNYYTPYGPTTMQVRTNVIMGVKGQNLALFTQLVKG